MFVYILGFLCRLLRGVDEDGQHRNGKDDANGVCHCGVVDGGALGGLAVQHAAQALGCQHEVGAGHCSHEGSSFP